MQSEVGLWKIEKCPDDGSLTLDLRRRVVRPNVRLVTSIPGYFRYAVFDAGMSVLESVNRTTDRSRIVGKYRKVISNSYRADSARPVRRPI